MTMERKLTLARVDAELPEMTSPENVKMRLQVITNWALAGLVPGVVANACVRGCEVWWKVHDLEMDRERTRQLERRVKELQDALEGRGTVRRA